MTQTVPVHRPKRRSSRREEVLQTLRQAIVIGELADGERLIEDRIARELNTSRGPVREALRQLEHEGLVISYPYRGAVVLGVSDEEVHEVLIPIRLTLERFSFTKAARADDRGRLRGAGQGGVADGRGRSRRTTCCAVSRPTSASTSSCSRAPASPTRHRSGAASRRASAPTSSASGSRRTCPASRSSTASCWPPSERDTEVLMAAVERHITVRTPGPAG